MIFSGIGIIDSSPGLVAPTPVLDTYGGAALAFSLRKLRTAYSGPAIRVRRSSDNAESDIGFVNNLLDIGSLLSFCGGSNGFVRTWYNQSAVGGAPNAIQTSATSQPKIVNSGAVIPFSNYITMVFDGSNDYFTLSGNQWADTVNTTFYVADADAAAFGGIITSKQSGDDNAPAINYETSNKFIVVWQTSVSVNPATTQTAPVIGNAIYTGTDVVSYFNNSSAGTVSQTGSILPDTNNWIGTYRVQAANFYNGKLSELFWYLSDQSSNRSAINTNINQMYGVY